MRTQASAITTGVENMFPGLGEDNLKDILINRLEENYYGYRYEGSEEKVQIKSNAYRAPTEINPRKLIDRDVQE